MEKNKGLCKAEVEKRKTAGNVNTIKNKNSLSVWDIVRNNVFTYFNLLHILLFFSLILTGGKIQNMLFIIIITINTLIGLAQELRAKKTIEKLTLLTAPTAMVIRDGETQTIEVEDLVLDDVVIFNNGNQVCADAVIINGEAEINESLLTGESEPVKKRENDNLLSGSFISSGSVTARLIKVGNECYAAKLANDAKKHKRVNSEILNALNKILKVVGIAIIPIGILLFSRSFFFNGLSLSVSATSTVGALIGMIPEGLYLLTTVALAVSVIRLGRQKTLVREIYAIESLARVDVLCIDKTGTITSGEMNVCGIENLNDEDNSMVIENMLSYLNDDNQTQKALNKYFTAKRSFVADKTIPFSSKRKWSGCRFNNAAYVLGAAEFIMKNNYSDIKEKIEGYSKDSKRVLLLAKCDDINDDEVIGKVIPLCLIIIEDTLRQNVKSTFKFFAENEVEIKVISGDNPLTVSAVAKRAGIKNAENYIDLTNIKDDDIENICDKYNVFGRVTPKQKRLIVKALKKQKHTVAMTGDGVNDVMALKDSDCSIAMAQGSEAARQVSTLVLTDNDFSAMPKIVTEGRQVINNIQRASSLFLVKTIYSSSLALLLLFLPMTYPLQPVQLSIIGALTVGIPGFFLALRKNKALVKGNFFRNVFNKALPSGICVVVGVLAILVFNIFFNTGHEVVSSMATIFVGGIGFLTLFKVCMPFDKKNMILFSSMLFLFIMSILLFKNLLLIVSIPIIPFLFLTLLFIVSVFLWLFISNLIKRRFKSE